MRNRLSIGKIRRQLLIRASTSVTQESSSDHQRGASWDLIRVGEDDLRLLEQRQQALMLCFEIGASKIGVLRWGQGPERVRTGRRRVITC